MDQVMLDKLGIYQRPDDESHRNEVSWMSNELTRQEHSMN